MTEIKPVEVIMRIDYAVGESMEAMEVMAHAEEVQELVRCRECRWFGEFCDEYKQKSRKDGMCEHPKLGRNTVCTVFDFYCADGEREVQE